MTFNMAIQLPEVYTDDLLGWEIAPEANGNTRNARVYSLVYPPIGFFRFYGIGNGDDHGFYWPLGMEDKAPLVAFTSHDVGAINPENSDIERFYLCELARSGPRDEDVSATMADYRALAEKATGHPQPEEPADNISTDDVDALLRIDPHSPFLLTAVGDICLLDNDPEHAVEYYLKAVTRLPEYVAAHFGLALAYRRMRRAADMVRHLRETLVNSSAFYGGSFWRETWLPGNKMRNDWQRKSLLWLQRSNECPPDLDDDPFLRVVKDLRLELGVKESRDIAILQSLVDEYAQRNQCRESVRLWLRFGEHAAAETTSFRERLGLTPRHFGTRLSELLALAGLTRRAKLTNDMLSRMEKPDGMYL